MEQGNSIRSLILSMAKNGIQCSSIQEGVVIKAAPLTISLVNDKKIILTDDDLIVPNHLTDYKVKIDIKKEWSTENENGCSEKPLIHSHKIKGEKEMIVKNALKVGDKVDLLSFNDNKTYYILDRVPK